MANVRFVLVEPQEAGNVGAAARVIRNFGSGELWIVGAHPPLFPVAGWWASGADEVLEGAQFRDTLHEAIGDAHLTIATTSMRGRTSPVDLQPSGVATLFEELPADHTLALVFGREDHGLTREEVMACQQTASIPTNPVFPTMNLAQSIGIFAYELSSATMSRPGRIRPTAALVERMHERMQSMLVETGFLHGNNADRIYDDLRAIAGRADLDERETTIVLGILRQMEWKLKSASS